MRKYAAIAFLLAVTIAATVWNARRAVPPPRPHPAPLVIPADGPITIAAAGDVLFSSPVPASDRDAAFASAVLRVSGATVALANLELNLLGPDRARAAQDRPAPKWLFGTPREADELKALGFDLVSLANNHAADFGPDAVGETGRVLDEAGLLHAGTGADLAAARAPVFAGSGARRLAFLSLSSSTTPDSCATSTRGDIKGRPGLSPLRYVANVTVDRDTFRALRESAASLPGGSGSQNNTVTLFGTTMKRGDKTSVSLAVDPRDAADILEQIRLARAQAPVVVVSIHGHEPDNGSAAPADFLRQFAHEAIDAGASMIVGHGPHRLRGIEVYGGGVILYSLGNFLYQARDLDYGSQDVFDAGIDMFSLAMGVVDSKAPAPSTDNPAFWESAIAVATLAGGGLSAVRLYPVDLGAHLSSDRRGIPRLPSPDRATAILERLAALSTPYGTDIHVRDGVGLVEVPPR